MTRPTGDMPAPCAGTNCGITRNDQEHSPECVAEHAASAAGSDDRATRRQTLIDALIASKQWLTDYAAAFVDDFADAAPAAQGEALPPLVKVLAEWEDRNGSLAGILPSEWILLRDAMTDAAVVQSPRQLRAALASQGEAPPPSVPAGLFEFLAHGDEAHQTWLKSAIAAFFAGQPRPPIVLAAAPPPEQAEARGRNQFYGGTFDDETDEQAEARRAAARASEQAAQPAVPLTDGFRGDNAHLVRCIEALLAMDADGALSNRLGGHARGLLSASAARLATPPAQPAVPLTEREARKASRAAVEQRAQQEVATWDAATRASMQLQGEATLPAQVEPCDSPTCPNCPGVPYPCNRAAQVEQAPAEPLIAGSTVVSAPGACLKVTQLHLTDAGQKCITAAPREQADAARYCKDGESVLQCIERHRREQDALLLLLAKERQRIEDADRTLRRSRQFLLRLQGPSTPLAVEFNQILAALGTFEPDCAANARREDAARKEAP